MTQRDEVSGLSRRRLLRALGLAGAGAAATSILAACGQTAASPTSAPAAQATKPAAGAGSTPAAAATPAAKVGTTPAAGTTPSAAGTPAAKTGTTPAAAGTPAAKAGTTPAAAGATPAAKAAQPAPSGKGDVTLRYHTRAGSEAQMYSQLFPIFEQENPGVKVTIEESPGAEYGQRLQTLAAGNQIGDVLYLFTNNASFQLFFVSGIFAPLDDRIRQDNVDLGQWYKYSIDACRVDGKLGGLPFKSHPSRVGLFYNEDIFQKAGIAPPDLNWTYEQLTETAKRLHNPPDVYGFSHPWRDISYYPIMSRMYGGDFYTEDGRSTMIEKEESQQGWVWHYDMMNTHKVTLNPIQTAPTPNDLFVSGNLAMLRANVGTKAGYRAITNFKWNMTLAPAGPTGKRGSLAETDVQGMTTQSTNPDMAWRLLRKLTSREAGVLLAQQNASGTSSTPGGRPDVYESPEHLDLPYPQGVQQRSLQAMNEVDSWRGPENFRGPEVTRLVDERADLLLLNSAQPNQQFFNDLKNEIQDILDRPRP